MITSNMAQKQWRLTPLIKSTYQQRLSISWITDVRRIRGDFAAATSWITVWRLCISWIIVRRMATVAEAVSSLDMSEYIFPKRRLSPCRKKVLLMMMMMKASKLGWAEPGSGQEQGRSKARAGGSMSRAGVGQEQDRSTAE